MRLLGQEVAYRWIGDARFLVTRGETGLTCNIYCGLQEVAEMTYVLHVLRPGDLFVDAGANVGSYSLLAGAVRHCRVICFEPVPATFARLGANLRLNDLGDLVSARNVGLGEGEGTLRFSQEENCTNHVLAEGDPRAGIDVPVTILDQALAGQVPALVKIDVEGFELAVLRGAPKLLADPGLRSILLEMGSAGERYGFAESDLLALLRSHGFLPYDYDPFSRTLKPLEGRHREAMNTIFIRDLDWVRERVRGSETFRIKSTDL